MKSLTREWIQKAEADWLRAQSRARPPASVISYVSAASSQRKST